MSGTAWKCEPYDASKDGVSTQPPNKTEFKAATHTMTAEEAATRAVHTSRRVTLCQGPDNQIHIFNGGFLKK